ncbi:hypothetical protein JST97_02550 [bacterium]|nr:hypothetical protein [bacterium]
MKIMSNPAPLAPAALPPSGPKNDPPEPPRVKEEFQDQADVYNASRGLGNKVSGALTGVAGHLIGNVAQMPAMVGSTYRNLWKAETIGPYAKIVGSFVALAGIPMVAAGALLATPFMGIAEAFQDSDRPYSPLKADTIGEVAGRITNSQNGPATLVGKAIANMDKFGNKKLAPGQEPWDIPLDKIFKGALDGLEFLMVKVPVQAYKIGKKVAIATKDVAVEGAKLAKQGAIETAKFVKEYAPKLAAATFSGVTSALIAGPAGLVIGTGVGLMLAAKDIKHAVTDKDRSFASRVGGVAKTLAYIPVGPVMAGLALRDNFSRGFSEGWHGHPIESIKTTGKAVMEKAREALHGHKGEQ